MPPYAESIIQNDVNKHSQTTNSVENRQVSSASREYENIESQRKAELKKIALNVKKDFRDKVFRSWNPPLGAIGEYALARVTLNDSGSVFTVEVQASNPDVKRSVERAIRNAAPYPMPSDPDARREVRRFTASFTVK